MLFYTSLLITSFLITVIILALYNLVVALYKKVSVSRSSVPNGPTSHLSESKYGRNVKGASKPWGNPASHAKPSDLARTHPAKLERPTPWGWPGNQLESQEVQTRQVPKAATLNTYLARNTLAKGQTIDDWKHNVGRPMRDDRPALAGTAYKPSFVNFPDFDSDNR